MGKQCIDRIKAILKKIWDAKWKILLGIIFGTILGAVCCGSAIMFPVYNLTAGVIGCIYGIAIFVTYLVAAWWLFGVTRSISITYYYVNPRWLFQMFMWGAIFSILIIGQCWWSAVVGFLFGVMTMNPSVNGGNIYFIPHMVSAISAIAIGNISLGVMYGLWWMVGLLALILGLIFIITQNRNHEEHPLFNKENRLYWIEVVSISFYIIGLILGNIVPFII